MLLAIRILTLSGALAAVVVLAGSSTANAASKIYVANCSNTSYLQHKPRSWSAGCTGGSPILRRIRWNRYGARSASARGRGLLRVPATEGKSGAELGYYRARGRLRLSRPRTCRADNGSSFRYFSRVTWHIKMRHGNPFERAAGWYGGPMPVYGGTCTRS